MVQIYAAFNGDGVSVLVSESVPNSLYDLQRGVVRWQARLFTYHASLVDRAPPLSFDGSTHFFTPGTAPDGERV